MQKNALCDLIAVPFSNGPLMLETPDIHDPAKQGEHAITNVSPFCSRSSVRKFPTALRKTIVKVMKLTAFFMLVLSLHVSARTSSQTISFSGKGISIKKVISVIEKQTGFLVFANEELLYLAGPITVTARNLPLKDFLDLTFKDQPLKYVIDGISILVSRSPNVVVIHKPALKQTDLLMQAEVPIQTITGTITDSTGVPLVGATISVKGKKISVTTDASGKFEIKADVDDVLLVSYVGFQSRSVTVRNTNDLHIMLRIADSGMDEVVVVGYGTQKKSTVTGSIATVKGSEIQKAPTTNLTSALAGRMTGVIINTRGGNPGNENINIFIRGKSSWQGGGPLIIVDGIANRSGWERINPDEIESVSVLKDASASIYGSRAANGVILITTKRGKSGSASLEYHGDYGFTQATRFPEMTRSWQYAQYYTEAKRSGYIFTPEEIEKFKAGSDPNLYPNYNLNDYALSSGAPQTTHTLSLKGGNEAVKYFISGRYLYQGAVYNNAIDNFKSYNVRSNIDVKASKNLNFSLNISGRRDDKIRAIGSDASNGFFEELLGTDPTKPIFYKNGLPASIYDNNLVEMIKGKAGNNNDNTTTINSQFTAKWDMPFITKGLYLEGTGAYDFSNVRTKQFSQSYDLYSYNNSTDDYSNLNTNPVLNRGLYDYFYNSHRYTLNARIGYDKTFGSVHNISAFAAYEQYSTNNEWISASRSTFLSNQIPYLFMGAADDQKNDGSGYEYAYRNFFGRAAYAYNSKYLLDITLRRDESLKFAPSNRTGWFPGISAGWRLSEEAFVKKNFKSIDNLKLRASWGQMGSDNVSDYQYLASAAIRAAGSSMVLGANPAVVPTLYLTGTSNPDISWEVANTYNVALEGSLWKGLFGFELEYFYSKRSNILATRNASVPTYTGLVLPAENIGKAQNQGVEVLVTHRNHIGLLRYDIGVNVTYTANKILYMDESANIPNYQRREGHPIDSWLVYKTNGIFNNQKEFDETPVKRAGAQLGDIIYVDVDGDNAITDKDKVRLYASSLPKYTFGIPMNFEYKKFDMNLLWQGQEGAKTYLNPTERNGDINVPLWLYNDRWTTATGETATMPRAFYHRSETYNTITSDFWMKDASFIRLKSLQIGYSLPENIISKLSMSSVRFYVSGFNLLLFDKIKDYDPEVVNNLGVFYPSTKVYNLGVRVIF